jgi:hypothetical protein
MLVILLHALTDALPWLIAPIALAGLLYAAAQIRRRPERTATPKDRP